MDLKILEEFGLTKNEQDIFLTIIKNGTISATHIARGTGLNRPYVYYALERLLEKGYLSEISVNGKKHFKAIDLNQITSLEQEKVEMLKKTLQALKQQESREKEELQVEVWKGRYALRNIHKKITAEVKSNQEILYLGLNEDIMEETDPLYLRKSLQNIERKKIRERIIIKRGTKKLPYAKTAKYRFIKKELIGQTARVIYQDIVIEILYGTPVYVIVKRNAHLADIAKQQFEVFWKLAKSQ